MLVYKNDKISKIFSSSWERKKKNGNIAKGRRKGRQINLTVSLASHGGNVSSACLSNVTCPLSFLYALQGFLLESLRAKMYESADLS